MDWLRRIDQTSRYTCPVRSGALLAAAGVLRNRGASSQLIKQTIDRRGAGSGLWE